MRGHNQERTSQYVDPHELSSEFLLRMWPQDRAAPLVCLDQPPVLRQVLAQLCEVTMAAPHNLFMCAVTLRRPRWPRLPPRSSATNHRTTRTGTKLSDNQDFIKWSNAANSNSKRCSDDDNRRRLHLRRAHKERHPVFSPRTWTSTLLATQRRL